MYDQQMMEYGLNDISHIEIFYLQINTFPMLTHRSFSYRQLFNIFKNHDFLFQNLRLDRLGKFGQMVNKITLVLDYNIKLQSTIGALSIRLKEAMQIIDEFGKGHSLGKIFKKMSIIHIFIRNAALNEYEDDGFTRVCEEELQKIKKDDFKRLMKDKNWGIEKFSIFLKDVGKENCQSLQNQTSKGVVKQLIDKVYYSFYHYLSKILQDQKLYGQILLRKMNQNNMVLWKIINLSKHLGSITNELNRICRYFRKDLSGIHSHFAYLISLDINSYYDLIRQTASDQCKKWAEDINKKQLKRTKDYEMSKEKLFKDQDFIELRRIIEEIHAIRQDLIWIYLNQQLKGCLKYFSKPINGIQVEIDPKTSHILQMQNFIQQGEPLYVKRQLKRRTSIELSGQPDLIGKQFDLGNAQTGLSIGQTYADVEEM